MKLISAIIIALYLLLPVMCFAHPCSFHDEAGEIAISAEAETDGTEDHCPLNAEDDNCEVTCCCAGHAGITTSFVTFPLFAGTNFPPFDPDPDLPQLIDRIFIPPRNLS